MKAILGFIKATLVGGILFVVPLVVLVLLVREAIRLTTDALRPVAQLIPEEQVVGVVVVDLLAVLAILALCFAAGLFVGTRPGRAVSDRLEQLVLRRVPGFTFLKSVTHGIASPEKDSQLKVALARIEEAWVIAFVVERHGNGMFTVFVPSAPTPAAGAIYFLTEDRIKWLEVSVLAAVTCIMQLGVGSRELVAGAFRNDSSPENGPRQEEPL